MTNRVSTVDLKLFMVAMSVSEDEDEAMDMNMLMECRISNFYTLIRSLFLVRAEIIPSNDSCIKIKFRILNFLLMCGCTNC